MVVQSLIKRLNSVEKLTFVYIVITTVYILTVFGTAEAGMTICSLLSYRLIFVTAILLMALVAAKTRNKIAGLIRYIFPFSLIAYWYPETYCLGGNLDGELPGSIIAPNLDGFFDRLDTAIFGCSPAGKFSALFPSPITAEIMYFGYFAYYLIFLFMFTYFYFARSGIAESAMFYCLCSFFIFYIIFTLVPVAGPQFYYSYPDNQVPEGYAFSRLMRSIQNFGEKPTGAFPSSHVGLTIIAMILLYRNARKYFYIMLPVATILVASTVYIKAHYLIDVIAAFVATPFIFLLSKLIFRLFKRGDKNGTWQCRRKRCNSEI